MKKTLFVLALILAVASLAAADSGDAGASAMTSLGVWNVLFEEGHPSPLQVPVCQAGRSLDGAASPTAGGLTSNGLFWSGHGYCYHDCSPCETSAHCGGFPCTQIKLC